MTVEEEEAQPASGPEMGQHPKTSSTILQPRDVLASFRKGFGWRPVAETDRRTLVENIVISIENEVGGGREGTDGERERDNEARA